MPTAKRAKKTTPKPKAAPKRPNRRLALYDLAAFSLGRRGSRQGNPYAKAEVRAALRALGDPSGYDLADSGPKDKVGRALYDLAAFSLGRRGSRDGNPYGKEEVRAAIRIFGDPSGFDLPERYAAR